MTTTQETFSKGDAVIVHGYEGRVVREYLEGMFEVRLGTGLIVVPTEEISLVA